MKDIDDIYWCDEWGEEPIESKEKRKLIIDKIRCAPKLIPIYSHRYLASIEVNQNPVFSIAGADVIYYGENLLSYYLIEFGLKQYDTMKCESISHIPFWSDLL
jgi:hypothetical protein